MGFKFQLGAQFGALKDVAAFPCPLGTGATFFIRRSNAKAVRDRRRARLQKDPIQQVQLAVLMTSDDVAALFEKDNERKALPPASGEQPEASEVSEEKAARDLMVRIGRASTRDALRAGMITPEQLAERFMAAEDGGLEEALDVLSKWENMPGEDGPIAFSEEAARELLSVDGEVPEGHEYAGKTVGHAFRAYILACSDKHEAFREKVVEAAGKNLQPSSGGSD